MNLNFKQGSSSSKSTENLRILVGGNATQSGKKSQQLNRIKTTKYTLLTFLPINFYDQFRRAVYFYFLVVTIISFFINSTLSPMVSLIPLLFVMIVTGIKEAHEDYQRYKNDNLVNYSKVTVLRDGQEREIESRYVCPGDLVVVRSDCDVPCDVVLLHSTDKSGKCFVTTANLDGETNLKTLTVPRGLPEINYLMDLNRLGVIECESPRTDLYKFNGKIEVNGTSMVLPLTSDNLLLRGSKVKNTEKVIGCAVYTGMSTKLQLNSRYTGNKSASSEIYINKFLIFLVVLMVVACIILYMLGRYEEINTIPFMDYLGPPIQVNAIANIIEDFLAFLILFNYMIPISMYMNIELYRVLNAFFIQQDQKLYDSETDQRAVVNSSNLNEDLGQVNILFSDKTGTLTKNEMIFQQCSIGGVKYMYRNYFLENVETKKMLSVKEFEDKEKEFFRALTLCHTVQIAQSQLEDTAYDLLEYQASSPDEKALLEACRQLGFIYLGDDNDLLKVKILLDSKGSESKIESHKRLNILEFSSERKRMSVIVADSENRKWLYTKGAESAVFELCSEESKEMIRQTDPHITEFAKEGLRTLAVARRLIPEDEYEEFCNDVMIAQNTLESRQELMDECYKRVECDLELLGATAVEDALQENVCETLTALQKAGMKIWVLTGDKVETAVNIALACGHIPPDAQQHFVVNYHSKEEVLDALQKLEGNCENNNENSKHALIMDGPSLAIALKEIPEEFRNTALKCTAVLCCRLNPLQKSEVVTLVKKQKGFLTAAIGDGANDVSMIQEADVGIGIMGKEGLQAARCSDFSIAKFFMLQRLLLVHGHYNTARLSFLVLFYCYKNILITGIMVLFQIYDLFSSTSVYHSLYMWLFDVIYISFSFTFLAISEKPYSEEVLMGNPHLYQQNSQNRQVRWTVFLRWILNGAFHSIVVFFFAYFFLTLNNVILNEGQTAEYYIFGSILIQLVVVVGNLKLMLESHYLSYVYIGIIIASFLGFILSTVIYNFIDFPNNPGLYHAYNRVFTSLPCWLFTIVTAVACLVPDYTAKVIRSLFCSKSSKLECRSNGRGV
ncbi:phospholipid-transporting ATPase IF-like [Musca vetustissima]|uniref:phospholipid-transporting ATPase IF-like n=1 Tax=Musca vetustissima TaxID=27455 RepID=UPI002AB6D434|nr:phospholipid-transporting ATPase IF-like [Musca vetustissima]